jgi:hypothetical protein
MTWRLLVLAYLVQERKLGIRRRGKFRHPFPGEAQNYLRGLSSPAVVHFVRRNEKWSGT